MSHDPKRKFKRKKLPTVREFGPAAKGGNGNSTGQIKRRADRATRDEMETVQRHIEDGNRERALDYLDELIAKYPKDFLLYQVAANTALHHGMDSDAAGDNDASYAAFEDASNYALTGLNLRISDGRLLCTAAQVFRKIGDFEKADAFYERALLVAPQNPRNLVDAAFMHLEWSNNLDGTEDFTQKELRETAADLLQKAILIGSDDDAAHDTLEGLIKEGYEPDPEGFDIGDDAVRMILDHNCNDDQEDDPQPTFTRSRSNQPKV